MERRRFLLNLSLAGAGAAALGSLPPGARRALAAIRSAPPGVIVRNDWPEHWETSIEALGQSFHTPNRVFFVRSHLPVPEIDAKSWRLEVAGLARAPRSLSLAELKGFPAHEEECVLECAGNGRARYGLPSTSGTQWEYGAVGNARWGGTRLSDVLNRAGIPPEAKHVWFECADRAPLDSTPRFLRSIPIEKAMGGALLVWKMNGEALPLLHGAPVRVIVPGWFGMASAKWVTKIRLEAAPSDNHFMVRGYRYNYPGVDPAAAGPVQELRVKSLITSPLDGAVVPAGRVPVRGLAWSAGSPISTVEISSDGGTTWRPAKLGATGRGAAWSEWTSDAELKSGEGVTLAARATTVAGETQPPAAQPNAGGYGNNSIHVVTLHARG
ncbi:MAG TPA: sulfite oxidase [Candidatus Udaeobacter sp.]|nr:sulfite oxidase [Candidatus Udaeobacter sp.]